MSYFWSTLSKPIIGLSPMDGVTDFPMREIQAEIGKPDVMYTEFVSIEGFLRKPEIFLPKLKFSPKQRPIIAQLFGASPDSFSKVIPKIVKLGFNGIDLNMGCPSKNILEQGGGGALIGNYDLVKKILNTILSTLSNLSDPIPLSVKTRIGNTLQETQTWLTFLSKFPLSAICVHARPLKQLHSGPVQFDQLAKFSKLFQSKKIIFLGNGGIKNRKEGLEISQKYHLDGVLIGQGAIGNPWVFSDLDVIASNKKLSRSEIPPTVGQFPTQKILFSTLTYHSQLAWDFYGEKGFPAVRKHLSAYCKNFSGAKNLRQKLLQAQTPQEIKNIIKNYY